MSERPAASLTVVIGALSFLLVHVLRRQRPITFPAGAGA
jgi:hypothetical protein